MAFTKKKGGDKKRKGGGKGGLPKGKKARAKAKLDRQWGEHPIASEQDGGGKNGRRRIGKSRLVTGRQRATEGGEDLEGEQQQQQQQNGSVSYRGEAGGDSDSTEHRRSDDEDEEEDDEEEESGGALNSLLGAIRGRSGKINGNRPPYSADTSDDDDDDDSSSSNSSSEGSDDDDDDVAGGGGGKDDGENVTGKKKGTAGGVDEKEGKDFWKERYVDRPLFSEDEAERDRQLSRILREGEVSLAVAASGTNAAADGDLAVNASRPLAEEELGWTGPTAKVPTSLPDLVSPCISRYADTLLAVSTSAPAGRRNKVKKKSAAAMIDAAVARHVAKHVQRTRLEIVNNDHRPLSASKKDDDGDNVDDSDGEEDPTSSIRDRGYTRPTVLALLPTRNCCYEFVRNVLSHAGGGNSSTGDSAAEESLADGWERFREEYGPPPPEQQQQPKSAAEAEEDADAARKRRKLVLRQKGQDWLDLFGDDVNDDDDFKLGLAFQKNVSSGASGTNSNRKSRKKPIKLFTDFYRSDVVVASPLALKVLMQDHERGGDFLSSIEICFVARADVLLMQNWDHVADCLDALNKLPQHTADTDFSRVREYFLAGQSKHWRQLIVTSEFLDPMILSTFKRHAQSGDGWVRIRRKTSPEIASISRVLLPTRQVFQRVPASSFATQGQDRVRYFVKTVLDEIISRRQKHTLVFIPSYFDFVSVRNILLKRDDEVEFVSVTEYSRTSEVSRGRARFLQGRKPIMLYTGRAHFFHRHAIKGARHVVFLGLPEQAQFYADHVNRLGYGLPEGGELADDAQQQAASQTATESSLSLFTKYEAHALERIVGSTNCHRMIHGDKSTFLFG